MIASHPFLTLLFACVIIPFLVLSVVLRHYSRGGERDRQVIFARQWYLLLLIPLVWIVVAWQLGQDRPALFDQMRDHGSPVAVTLPLVLFAWMFSYYAWVWVAITTAIVTASAPSRGAFALRKTAIILSALVAIAGTSATIGLIIAALVVDTRDVTDVSRERTIFRLISGLMLLFFAWGLSMGWADGSTEYGRRQKRTMAVDTTVEPDQAQPARNPVIIHALSQLIGIGLAGAGFIILYLTAQSLF